MNIDAKNILSAFLILLITCFSCSSGKARVKPSPGEGDYTLCPVCKGRGVIETYLSKPPQTGLDLNEKEKGCAESCIFPFQLFFLIGAIANPDKSEDGDKSGTSRFTRDTDIYSKQNAESSSVKKLVKCQRCEGQGWIKTYESSGWSMDSKQTSEGFKRANEILDGKKSQ